MTDEQNNNSPPIWYIDNDQPGSGSRPDWLPDKFKSVSEMAKSYHELEKKFGTPPENYDIARSKYLDPDYVPFGELQQLAKEKRVPKEVIDKMVDSFDKYLDEFSDDGEDEFKKLGNNAQERITTLNNWAKANLSKDAYDSLKTELRTANSIKALEELRGKIMSTNPHVPNGNDGQTPSTASIQDLQNELSNPANLKKYKEDEKYRKDYQGRLESASKASHGYVDKVGA